MLQQIFEFSRDAREGDHRFAVQFDDKPGGGADRIFDSDGTHRHGGLTPIIFGWLAAEGLETLHDLLPQVLAELELEIQPKGHPLSAHIVYRGPKPAGGDQDLRSLERVGNGGRDALRIVTHRAGSEQVVPVLSQRNGDHAGIRVDDLAQEQLGSDGEDFGVGHKIPKCLAQHGPRKMGEK